MELKLSKSLLWEVIEKNYFHIEKMSLSLTSTFIQQYLFGAFDI